MLELPLAMMPFISIHVPREGDDLVPPHPVAGQQQISIHVPREGDDLGEIGDKLLAVVFQSTSPVRGTTVILKQRIPVVNISIHVPREGDDGNKVVGWPRLKEFQSTSPVRGTTFTPLLASYSVTISIHVPREGDDPLTAWIPPLTPYFNPRPP